MAVVALGGYARRELCPASDIDLVLLHDGWGRTDLEGLVEALCYPLWDAGLSVGHAVRTPAEAVADAGGGGGVDAATAVLDRRLVAGDPGLVDALTGRVRRWSTRRGPALLRALAAADTRRHDADGAHPGMLEPNVKNGAGGLRDLHSLRWAAGWLLGECALDPLVAAGYLGADDRHRLSEANGELLAVRCALHQRSASRGKLVDVLRLDQQDEVAAALRAAGPAPAGDADALLRRVGLAMRLVAHLHARTWALVLSDLERGRRRRRPPGREMAPGVRLEAGVVDIDAEASLRRDPALGLRAAAVVATTGASFSRRTSAELFGELATQPALPWSAAARSALLTLLHAGTGAAEGLAEADHVGLLTAHIPQWQRVRGHPQRNPLHRFDLDTHGAQAVVELHALRRDEDLEQLWNGLADPDLVVLAAWLHDIGKAWPGDHSLVGADVAEQWLCAMEFDSEVATSVATLIRHHLLLPDVATRRDLDDPAVLAAVARKVGDATTLDALYLLSLADARATGPAAWSPWKEDLMATLHQRVSAHMRGSVSGPEPALVRPAFDVDAGAVARLAARAPTRYFDAATQEQIALHARLLDAAALPGIDVRGGRVTGTTIVSILAQDRSGLLADCAGVLAALDLSVLEARAFTTSDGMALDWFTVTGDVDPPAAGALLRAALDGSVDVGERLTRPRWRGPAIPWAPHRGATVTLRGKTTFEVEAADRLGLLFGLCQILDTAGLQITAIRAATLGPRVFDVFEVRNAAVFVDLEQVRNQLLSAAEGTT